MGKLLVTGSTGLVGAKVTILAGKYNFEVYPTHNRQDPLFPNSTKLDITDRDATLDLVREIRPVAVINTAALTNVDYCETHKNEADQVNVEGVKNLSDAAADSNARLVHISTDSVFDGLHGNYSETDVPHPINHYSVTKLESEKAVARIKSHAIARPSVIYGWRASIQSSSESAKAMNFAMYVLDKLRRGEKVRAVTDQYSSPTYADNLANALLLLATLTQNGVFHTAGRSCISRFGFASLLCKAFEYPTELIEPIASSEFVQQAARPRNCCLQVAKAEKALGIQFMTIEEGIDEMKHQRIQGSP